MLYSPFPDFLARPLIVSIPGDQIIVTKRNVEIHDKKLLGELVNFYGQDF